MEEIGLPELTSEQLEALCTIAEEAARKYIISKVPAKRVETLSITVETTAEQPLTLNIEVELTLSPLMRDFDVQALADEAVKQAFIKAEEYLRELKCPSQI